MSVNDIIPKKYIAVYREKKHEENSNAVYVDNLLFGFGLGR